MEVTRSKVQGSPAEFRSRQLSAQQMLRGDLDGPDLEAYVEERLLLTRLEDAQNWARKNAMWPLGFGLACCAIEMITVVGSPRNDLSRFGVSFYLVAMLFILFDIEVVFLYPIAVQLDAFGTFALVETIVFVILLLVAFVFVWRRGALEWK